MGMKLARVNRVFLFCLSAVCGTAHAERTEVYAGLALLDFRSNIYDPFDNDDDLFVREKGLLPGLAVEVVRKIGDWRLAADGRFFLGSTDFQVIPHIIGGEQQGKSDERMYDLSLRIAREFGIGDWSVGPYVGYGYHRRKRETRGQFGTGSVYTWSTAELGTFVKAPAWGRFEGGIDVRVFRVLEPEAEHDFGGFFATTTVELGERSGTRFGLVGAYLLEAGFRVRVDLYQERWTFGPGETSVQGSIGAIPVSGVVEGRSEYRNTGVMLGLVFGF